MRIAQRVLIIVTAAVLVVFGISKTYREREERFREQWEKTQTELFMQRVTANRCLSEEEYLHYMSSLNYKVTFSQIKAEEYQKEQDRKGNVYYYLVSWEEIQDCLCKDGNYIFEDNSVIRIEITYRGREGSVRNSYYGIASGKE